MFRFAVRLPIQRSSSVVRPTPVSQFLQKTIPSLQPQMLSASVAVGRSRLFSSDTPQQTTQDQTQQDQKAQTELLAQNQKLLQEVDESKKTLAETQKKAKDLEAQVLYALAEQENIRKIAQRDVENAKQFAVQTFATEILTVGDNLDYALAAVPEADRKGPLYDGIKLTKDSFLQALGRHGVSPLSPAVGEAFDPHKHQAMFEFPDPNNKPGTISAVLKIGYTLKTRLLRPAQVGVFKAPA